jgi:hypothetical protein
MPTHPDRLQTPPPASPERRQHARRGRRFSRTRVLVIAAAVLALAAGAGGIVFALQRGDGTDTRTREDGTSGEPTPSAGSSGVGGTGIVPRDATPADEPTKGARRYVTVDELQLGDCVNALLYPDAIVVPCSAAHEGEVVAVLQAPKGTYPGEEVLVDIFASECDAKAADYVGTAPISKAGLYVAPEVPYAADWDAHGRRIICSVLSILKEPLEGPVRA